jgi:sarcosine oxidase, subunit beta
MVLPRTADVVIIGGGVMGASSAYHLAARGLKNIILLEKEEFFGQGATGRCAGGVRVQFATEINIRLSLASLPMLERFKDEIGQDINFRRCGYLFVLNNEKDQAVFRNNVKLQHQLGIQTEWLDRDQIAARLPLMHFDDALAGTFHAGDGLVDPNSVVMGYIHAARKLGVQAFNNAEVMGIATRGGRVQKVETSLGSISTPVILLAAGPWSAQIGQLAGLQLPILPIRRQLFLTTPIPGLPADFPFVIDFAQSRYFNREGEGLLVGMSNANEQPGLDQAVDREFELVNFTAALSRMPILEKSSMVSHWAGLYEVTPDAHPIYGVTPVEGLLLVAGFSGHGFMHGPISGKLMAELILDGRFSSVDVSRLDLARFHEGSFVQEFNVV